jgi:protein-S-isoprenylcysteine O-methyltransferase Ste14
LDEVVLQASDVVEVSVAPRRPAHLAQPILILASTLFSLAYITLAITAWGWDDWRGFLQNPARAGVCLGMLVLFAGTFWLGCNLTLGANDRPANNWIFVPMFLVGLILGWLPASGDRHNHWTFGGNSVRYLGLGLFALGTFLRLGAVRTLGPRHSVWVAVQKNHQLVTSGFYRFIRHPSYLGALMAVFGWALAFRSGAGVLVGMLMIPPIVSRMIAEESLLVAEFGEDYLAYRRRTRRVLPLVY